MMNRRHFHAAAFALTPLAAALATLTACKPKGNWPAGMQPITWDRDTCARCSMVISERRFAAEIANPQGKAAFKFDDIGCALFWQRDKATDHPWMADAAALIWVADSASKGNDVTWLDARAARYVRKTSPMGYDFGATADNQADAIDFNAMRDQVLSKKR
ncbi:MAG: hypothetical protein LBE78_03790 [Burkholderiaceae bacterium]|jgi:nitrous oxide reductase accessory protein NosL|nr:hypothetical protein [Burkholderiaceae bacterium]